MKRLVELFTNLAGRTKPLDTDAFHYATKKVGDRQWDMTIYHGSEPFFRIATQTTPEDVQLIEDRAQFVSDVMNAAPEMSELAAQSAQNRQLAQELLDTAATLLLSLDAARSIGDKNGYTSDTNQRALIAVSRAEDALRALIIGNDGKAL